MWCVGPALPFAGAAVAQAWISRHRVQPDTRRFFGSFDHRSDARDGARRAQAHDAPGAVPAATARPITAWRCGGIRAPRRPGYDWARPELYQHIARVCERGKFDMVFFADLNYISDTYRGTMDAGDPPRHPGARARSDPAAVVHGRGHHAHRPRRDVLDQPPAPVLRRAPVGDARSPDARARGVERGDVAQPQPVGELRRGAPADRRALRPRRTSSSRSAASSGTAGSRTPS